MVKVSEILQDLVEVMILRAIGEDLTSISGSTQRIDLTSPGVKRKTLEWADGRVAELSEQLDERIQEITAVSIHITQGDTPDES